MPITSLTDTIIAAATHMRRAIQEAPAGRRPEAFADFPHGSCGDASMLLGAYLADLGHTGFRYVCGERGDMSTRDWTSHAWLALGELVVDITADQFPDAPSSIVVGSPSAWHGQFRIESTGPADFRSWSGPGIYHLHGFYAYLKSVLPAAGATGS